MFNFCFINKATWVVMVIRINSRLIVEIVKAQTYTKKTNHEQA